MDNGGDGAGGVEPLEIIWCNDLFGSIRQLNFSLLNIKSPVITGLFLICSILFIIISLVLKFFNHWILLLIYFYFFF